MCLIKRRKAKLIDNISIIEDNMFEETISFEMGYCVTRQFVEFLMFEIYDLKRTRHQPRN
jgi:hypothetical protein